MSAVVAMIVMVVEVRRWPLYSPEKHLTPTYGLWPTNMGVPREGVMVGFTQFHLAVVVGGLQPWRCPPSRRVRVRRGDRGIWALFDAESAGTRIY